MIRDYATSIKHYIELNKSMSSRETVLPAPFTLSMVSKQSLEKHPTFAFLRDRLTSYNKKVNRGQKIDEYEIRTYEKLFQLMFDLTAVEDSQLQENQLREVKAWLLENERIVKSRLEQVMERTVVTKESRKVISEVNKLFTVKQETVQPKESRIPHEAVLDSALPYFRKWRTLHEDIPLPSARLNYYERKVLNEPPAEVKQKSPHKYSLLDQPIPEYKDYSTAYNSIAERGEDDKEAQTQIELSQLTLNEENELPEEVALDDIPMFGDEKPEDDEEREENQDCDLVPKIKLYLSQTERKPQETEPRTSHAFMKLKQSIAEKRRELEYKHSITLGLVRKNEDREFVKLGEQRAKNKSTATKDQSRKMELRTLSPKYQLCEERRREEFRLSDELERRFHLSEIKAKDRPAKVDLSLRLPKLNQPRPVAQFEGGEKHSLVLLKKKYSDLLHLSPPEEKSDNGEEQVPKSIAQFSQRLRAYSSFGGEFGKLNRVEEFNQLENVREKFQARKVSVNARTLANGLLSPETKQTEGFEIVEKSLPHNEFMVETKKKKKKV